MSQINRRTFLKDSAMVAAGAGLSLTAQRTHAANSPNETIRVCAIGVHGRGGDHLRGFMGQKNVEVAAICDVDESVLNSRAAQVEKATQKKPAVFTDIRKALEDKSIDAVSIATPNHWHSLAAIWACQAGKDVYVEKPLSHNVSEGRKLVEAARKNNRIVQHGTQCRSSAGLIEAMKKLKEGVIGKVYMAKGTCYKWRDTIGKAPDEPVPAGVHYDLWLGPAPQRPFSKNRFHYNWHWHWDYGNGDLGNQGVHQMDIARWGLGVGLPSRVTAMGGHFMFDDDQETPNVIHTAFEYPEQKAMLQFEVRHWITNTEAGGSGVGVLFYGSEGYMEIPSYSAYKVYLGKKREPGPAGEAGGDHYGNFIAAVRSRKAETLNANVEEGHLSSALCHLGSIAYRLGRSFKFDPKTETIPGDAEAAKMLTRDYRAPYVFGTTA
jgi:predicted dehydrogenase